jgi:hypothetical protein
MSCEFFSTNQKIWSMILAGRRSIALKLRNRPPRGYQLLFSAVPSVGTRRRRLTHNETATISPKTRSPPTPAPTPIPIFASLERPEDEPEGTLDGPFDDTSTLVSLAPGSAVAANDGLEASAAACEPERRTRTTGAWKVSPLVPVPWVVMRVPPTAMVVVPRGLNV